MNSIPERDWKVFSNLHGPLVDRFCERALEEVTRAASNRKEAPYDRLSTIAKLVRQYQKDLNELGDHRRSTAVLVIARMHNREKLFRPGELEQFSQETRDRLLQLCQ